jgi:hypothetical protein
MTSTDNTSPEHPLPEDNRIAAVTLDPENPWLGLFSYTEETRAYFHGRDEETAELARRVQRKLLSVLFGQSGLGKTSLLRAGLVPRLRAEGLCPVYVRVDYAPESPSPSEQIKEAILKASTEAGYWTQAGVAVEGESLWEFMHHRGDLLRDADGRTLMPLLIFDQFEEVFTLGQADDAGRLRARQYLEDLADLVENRPPAALEARIEEDDAAAEQFDFARADYRILIALREDYLAHLESVKSIMPSITQNRMRLARMNGTQALSAVAEPGGKLVSQEVAESIVRFVAGGSELGNAEIEPSLLSLICRELNTVRLAQGRSEISADLLAGSRDTILSEFYERALADQPAGVRRVVEDELLTESGYRESLAEERVVKALAAAGAPADSLATLVNRRLLRIEDRLDMRRVELTHDVLCSVVLASRDLRHANEAREEAERQLAVQQEREATTKRALVRARMIATVCSVLMVVAAISAIFGWVNLRRARAADAQAQQARADAEKLVGFLIEDFYTELQPTGRLETLGKLAHMSVAYYDGLPPQLVTPRTQTLRAMALIREGAALYTSGDDEDAAYAKFGEAQATFEKLRAGGDTSEEVTYGLALALFEQGKDVVGGGGVRGTPKQLEQAAALLRPLVYAPKPSRQSRQTYAEILNYLSHARPTEARVATTQEARKILKGLGALELTDLKATAAYADTADSEARHLSTLGRLEEAKVLAREVYGLAEQVLAQRPGDLQSLSNRYLAADMLSTLASRQHDDAAAVDFAQRSVEAAEEAIRFNPSNLDNWSALIRAMSSVGELQYERGELAQTLATGRAVMALAQDKRGPENLGLFISQGVAGAITQLQASLGQNAAAEQTRQLWERGLEEGLARYAADDPRRLILANIGGRTLARLRLAQGQPQAALALARADLDRLKQLKLPADNAIVKRTLHNVQRADLSTASIAALRLGRGAEAEATIRQLQALPVDPMSGGDDPTETAVLLSRALAHAVVLQGRTEEARKLLEPALAYYRKQEQDGAKGTTFRRDFATALIVSALTHATATPERTRALTEAKQMLDGASAEAQQLMEYRELNRWIAAEKAKS